MTAAATTLWLVAAMLLAGFYQVTREVVRTAAARKAGHRTSAATKAPGAGVASIRMALAGTSRGDD